MHDLLADLVIQVNTRVSSAAGCTRWLCCRHLRGCAFNLGGIFQNALPEALGAAASNTTAAAAVAAAAAAAASAIASVSVWQQGDAWGQARIRFAPIIAPALAVGQSSAAAHAG